MLQLKADTESAAALIRGANERRAAERLREEAEHEAEKDRLTNKGLNPYKASNDGDAKLNGHIASYAVITGHLASGFRRARSSRFNLRHFHCCFLLPRKKRPVSPPHFRNRAPFHFRPQPTSTYLTGWPLAAMRHHRLVLVQVFKKRAVAARAVRKEKRQESRIRLGKEVRPAVRDCNEVCEYASTLE